MPLRASVRAGLTAFGLLAPVAASAQVFDLTISGIPLGTLTLDAEQSGRDYSAVSKITPNGLVNMVTGYAYDGRAIGRIDAAGKVTPLAFEADSVSPRANRRTEIEWKGDRPVRVSVEPPRKHQPDPENVTGALDPVSAGFALLRAADPATICDKVVEVFDGSRRSRLELGKPSETEGAFVCAGTYARIEGEAHSISDQKEYPFTLTFTPDGAGKVQLERIETRTRFGPAVVARRG